MSRLKPGKMKTQDQFTTAFNDVVQPFGWKAAVFGSHCVESLSHDERDVIESLLIDLSDSRGNVRAPRTIPDAFWRITLIPPTVLHQFSHVTDAKALACFLVPSSARLFYWRSISTLPMNDTALTELITESLQALPSAMPTCSGSVYQSREDGIHRIWFGRKAGREKTPSLCGAEVLAAVRALFQIEGN